MIDTAATSNLVVTLTTDDLTQLVKRAVSDALTGLNTDNEQNPPYLTKRYLNKHEICTYMGISQSTLQKWLRRGDFPCVRVEGVYRFRVDEVEKWIEDHRGIVKRNDK